MNSKATLSGSFVNLPAGRQGRILLFTFIFTFIFLNFSKAQNEIIPTYMSTINLVKAASLEQDGWKGAFLNVGGGNMMNGIEVFSQLSTCNSEDVVFLILINHNNYDVKVEWLGGFYTKNRQRIEDPEGMRSITIKANEEVVGDCLQNKELRMKLKDYIDRADKFNRYAPSSFEVILER